MGKFLLGVVVTLAVLILGALGFGMLGFFPTKADVPPPHWETHLAMGAVDASMDRHAPHTTNPVPSTDDNLEDGMRLYTMNCAVCHGGLDRKPSPIAKSFYPPAPDLILDPPDDPEWHTFYTVKTGIRYTGMPAWDKTLTDQEIWKITALLSQLEKLPPTVQEYWKNSFGVSPTGEANEKDEKKDDQKMDDKMMMKSDKPGEKHDHH